MSPPTTGEVAPPPTARHALTTLLTFVVVGVACGVVWWLLVHPAVFTKTKNGGSMGEVQLGKRFAVTGWYVVVAVVAGVLSGGVLTWRRVSSSSADPVLTVAVIAVGSVVAAALMAYVGLLLGPPDPSAVLAQAPIGARVPVQLSIPRSAWPAYVSWPVATMVGSLAALWSRPAGPS